MNIYIGEFRGYWITATSADGCNWDWDNVFRFKKYPDDLTVYRALPVFRAMHEMQERNVRNFCRGLITADECKQGTYDIYSAIGISCQLLKYIAETINNDNF